MARFIPIASPEGDPKSTVDYKTVINEEKDNDGMPSVFLLNLMMPAYCPPAPFFGSKPDGPGYSMLFHFGLTQEGRSVSHLVVTFCDSRACLAQPRERFKSAGVKTICSVCICAQHPDGRMTCSEPVSGA